MLIKCYKIHEKLATNRNYLYYLYFRMSRTSLRVTATTLKIMEISNDILDRGKQEEDDVLYQQKDCQLEEKSEKEILVIKEVEKVKKIQKNEEADKKIATFLHENGLSENLIRTLINTGLTDEHIRLLKISNLNDDDIDHLQDLWRAKIEVNESSDSIKSMIFDESSLDERAHLSLNSVYLKKVLSKPLIQALREIVMKKPADPVEYLGHWLLHFKICEEQSMQQKQRDLELSIKREILERKEIEDEKDLIEIKQEEELGEDWNYGEFTNNESLLW